jgi:hypothetical protein
MPADSRSSPRGLLCRDMRLCVLVVNTAATVSLHSSSLPCIHFSNVSLHSASALHSSLPCILLCLRLIPLNVSLHLTPLHCLLHPASISCFLHSGAWVHSLFLHGGTHGRMSFRTGHKIGADSTVSCTGNGAILNGLTMS